MSLDDVRTAPARSAADLRLRAASPPVVARLLGPPLPGADPGPPTTRPPRPLVQVALCEDQEVFRLGLRSVFEAQPDIAVVTETADLVDALRVADRPGARVVVIRQRLVGGATLPLLRELCRQGVGVLVLAENGADAGTPLLDVLQAGVRGFLPRRACAQRLVDAVRALARHEAALDSAVTSQLVRQVAGVARPAPPDRRRLDRLTERQREVAVLVAQGLSNEEIAQQLFLSLATVKSHLTAVLRRVEVRTRTQLAILVNREHSLAC